MAQRVILAVLATLLLGLQWRLWVANGGIAPTHRPKGEVAQQAAENESLRARHATPEAELQDLTPGLVTMGRSEPTAMGLNKAGDTLKQDARRVRKTCSENV